MSQFQILQISMNLEPGESIAITEDQIYKFAQGNLTSLLFDQVRTEDIEKAVEQIRTNYNVTLTENFSTGGYIMHKPIEQNREEDHQRKSRLFQEDQTKNHIRDNLDRSIRYEKTKAELIEIACRMSQEISDICEDAKECGSSLPNTEELLNEWGDKYREYSRLGGV